MYRKAHMLLRSAVLVTCVVLVSSGCSRNADDGKVPVTTSSEEARKEFLQGRDLSERALPEKARPHFEKALSLDSNFAMARLSLADFATTTKESQDHLKKALSLADKVSEGERLALLGNEARSKGDIPRVREYAEKLAAAYPKDERAQNDLGSYYYFDEKNYPKAAECLTRATVLAPAYPQPYNLLGYCYREMGNFADAEKAFKKYIELMPGDPNPYDSEAEILLKMGRFDESIALYRKALSLEPNFPSAMGGIAACLTYQGKHVEAIAELEKAFDMARNDGERRGALSLMEVVHVDAQKMDIALRDFDRQYAIAEKASDRAAMANAVRGRGFILMHMGKFDEATEATERSFKMTQESESTPEVKELAKFYYHLRMGNIAFWKKDYARAKDQAEEFRKGAETKKNPVMMKQMHNLPGRIAYAEKDYDRAISELLQTDQENAGNLYFLSLAYQGKKDMAKAKEYCTKAARWNGLLTFDYALVRSKAEKMLAGM